MIKYVIKRILLLIPVFLGVTFVIFAIVRMNPADPVIAILGINITDEQYAAKAMELGLDKPFLVQYLLYIKNIVLHLDLGVSYSTGRQVSVMIAERFGTADCQ
jgi:peptide/nickel transport system permease protein